MRIRCFAIVVLNLGSIFLGASTVFAQDYPTKPIRIFTTSVGGGADFTTRIIAQGISGPLGQPVVVENRSGAALAVEPVAKSAPDGYTLYIGGGTLWLSPLLCPNVPWDPVRDFAPISLVERTVFIVAVHPSVPAKSIKELIALAKARPGELNFASGAVGAPSHLATELFKSMAGVNIVNVPYKGASAAITGLISGDVQLTIFDAGFVEPHVKAGKLRALAVTTAEPSAMTPGLPTVASAGLAGYEAIGMTGMWAPAKTPAAIINRLNQEVVRAVKRPDVRERFLNAGVEPVGSSPEQFVAIIQSDTAKMGKVIKDANIKAD